MFCWGLGGSRGGCNDVTVVTALYENSAEVLISGAFSILSLYICYKVTLYIGKV